MLQIVGDFVSFVRQQQPTIMNTSTTQSPESLSSPSGSVSSDLRAKLDALSPDAKQWLEKTCERFADGQGYDKRPDEIAECLAAGLIEKRGKWIEVDGDVMGLVYSDSYFQRNREL
jgi:hypothetical protein